MDQDQASVIRNRDDRLLHIQQHKSTIALAPDEVRALDRRLADLWGIDFHSTNGDIWTLLEHHPDTGAVRRIKDAYAVVEAGKASEDKSRLYDAISTPTILGPFTSQRRHLILDIAALSIGLYRDLNLTGGILDVGCHAGFISDLLATSLRCPVTGIDISSDAVRSGKDRSFMAPVELIVERLPWVTDRRFSMVLCASAMPGRPTANGPFLKSMANLLEPGGVAIVMAVDWITGSVDLLRRQLRQAHFGFGFADVAGGYKCLPLRFEAESIVVLLKDGVRELPRKIQRLMESDWPIFSDYANTRDTPDREKLQAFERAKRAARTK